LLQNLLVLSVGGTMERKIDDEDRGARRSSVGRGVTVSATSAQSQIIAQAMTRGVLTLTLRNPDDVKIVEGLAETTDSVVKDVVVGANGGKP
jgi:pilus assembly protein CpaB